MKVVVTGGAGFIGSAAVRALLAKGHSVVTVDALRYAGRLESLLDVLDRDGHVFEKVDVCDGPEVRRVLEERDPDAVVHLAAETHVDRSIEDPASFVQNNVAGTVTLLTEALRHQRRRRGDFRFIHVSTDEVFGSLGATGMFRPDSPYRPRSPYAASKAAADHFVRAFHHTYGLATIVSNCSNNYGPRQFPEKLIPHMVIRALSGRTMPVYGGGENVRDWLHVDDHARALLAILERGDVGETYLVGGGAERSNIDVVGRIAAVLDELRPDSVHRPHADLIEMVDDRPGHDFRYAIDYSATSESLGWAPSIAFEDGLAETVAWYLRNRGWWEPLLASGYTADRAGIDVKEGT